MDQEIKAAWLKALREYDRPRIIGQYSSTINGQMCYCAVGLLIPVLKEAAWPGVDTVAMRLFPSDGTYNDAIDTKFAEIFRMSDGGVLFSAIADHIEATW